MSNTNGLLECRSVCGAGNPDSSFYLRKGQPISIVSPLTILSPDRTESATLAEDNSGLLSITNTPGSILMTTGPDAGVQIATDPQSSNTNSGLTVVRADSSNAIAGFKVDSGGAAVIDSYQGFAYVKSTQGSNNYSMILTADPFTGLCTISNPNNNADGEIIINTATAADSKLTVQVRPNSAVASGISIINVPNAPTQSATVNAAVDGSLELSATTNVVRVLADGNGGAGAGLTVKPATDVGISCLNLQNSSAATNPSIITLYNASATGGGLTSGHLQVYGYSGAGYNTIREIVDADYDGSAITLGDPSTAGGAVVSVAGASGSSRVYDPIYNPPPAFTSITSYTTTLTSATSATFPITATGLYMINAYIDFNTSLGGSATIPASGIYKWGLSYGDPAHGAVVADGTANQLSAESMTGGSSWGYMCLQTICTLASDTYEPNQRYKFSNYADAGFAGGSVVLTIYRLT